MLAMVESPNVTAVVRSRYSVNYRLPYILVVVVLGAWRLDAAWMRRRSTKSIFTCWIMTEASETQGSADSSHNSPGKGLECRDIPKLQAQVRWFGITGQTAAGTLLP